MVIFEEEGLKRSFKIILNSRGVIIMTKGFMGTVYKEAFSKLYHEVGNMSVDEKFMISDFTIDNFKITFDSATDAVKVKNLITLGKNNFELLLNYIGPDTSENDLDDIDEDDLNDDVTLNRFNRSNPQTANPQSNGPSSEVGISSSATLDYILQQRMNKLGGNNKPQPAAEPQPKAATPPSISTPPPIGMNCFSYYAYFEGKQQGPYDEKQFKALADYGLINGDTPVWKEGMAQWQKASTLPETQRFFATGLPGVPPPPPVI